MDMAKVQIHITPAEQKSRSKKFHRCKSKRKCDSRWFEMEFAVFWFPAESNWRADWQSLKLLHDEDPRCGEGYSSCEYFRSFDLNMPAIKSWIDLEYLDNKPSMNLAIDRARRLSWEVLNEFWRAEIAESNLQCCPYSNPAIEIQESEQLPLANRKVISIFPNWFHLRRDMQLWYLVENLDSIVVCYREERRDFQILSCD